MPTFGTINSSPRGFSPDSKGCFVFYPVHDFDRDFEGCSQDEKVNYVRDLLTAIAVRLKTNGAFRDCFVKPLFGLVPQYPSEVFNLCKGLIHDLRDRDNVITPATLVVPICLAVGTQSSFNNVTIRFEKSDRTYVDLLQVASDSGPRLTDYKTILLLPQIRAKLARTYNLAGSGWLVKQLINLMTGQMADSGQYKPRTVRIMSVTLQAEEKAAFIDLVLEGDGHFESERDLLMLDGDTQPHGLRSAIDVVVRATGSIPAIYKLRSTDVPETHSRSFTIFQFIEKSTNKIKIILSLGKDD
ncbi:MAG: hypothetical protein MN733_20985 [Nitrososphaera sp.]|nr:hypothetical protein [Nitrososphaera sp.]